MGVVDIVATVDTRNCPEGTAGSSAVIGGIALGPVQGRSCYLEGTARTTVVRLDL